MRRIALVIGLVVIPAIASADRIYLENGKRFDDVVVLKQTEKQIHFRVESGEMSLPLSWVERVEKATGALEQYLERKVALSADADASGEAWLRLARWARTRGVGHGFREALVMAGELEPGLDGLAPLMASIDFYFKPDAGVWSHGQPVVLPESRVQETAFAAGEGGRRFDSWQSGAGGQQEVAQGLTRAIERLAEAELERTRARRSRSGPARRRAATVSTAIYPIVAVPAGFATSGWVFRGEPLRQPDSDPDDPVIRNPRNAQARALLSRPPGSLLPLSAYRN